MRYRGSFMGTHVLNKQFALAWPYRVKRRLLATAG